MNKLILILKKYKKPLLVLFAIVLVASAVYFIRTNRRSNKFDISDDQRFLYEQYFALLRNRVAYVEYAKMKDLSPQRREALSEVKNTGKEALELLESSEAVEYENNKDAEGEFEDMRIEGIEVLKRQEQIVEGVEKLDGIFSQFFGFRPENISRSDIEENREQLIEDSSQSLLVIQNVGKKVTEYCDTENAPMTTEQCSELIEDLRELESLLEMFDNNLGMQDSEQAAVFLDNIIEQKQSLESDISGIYSNIFLSEDSVEMLKDETNLILKYKFYLDREN